MTIAPTTATTPPRAARPIFPETATGLASGAASQDAAVYGRTHNPKPRCPAGPRLIGTALRRTTIPIAPAIPSPRHPTNWSSSC